MMEYCIVPNYITIEQCSVTVLRQKLNRLQCHHNNFMSESQYQMKGKLVVRRLRASSYGMPQPPPQLEYIASSSAGRDNKKGNSNWKVPRPRTSPMTWYWRTLNSMFACGGVESGISRNTQTHLLCASMCL